MAWTVVVAVIALPVVEIALFIKSAQWLGLLPTIAAAIAAGAIGLALVRRQGLDLLVRARAQMDRGEVPLGAAFDGICLALAGALLVLPGFFSDVVAIALLLPPVRGLLRRWLLSRRPPQGGDGFAPPAGPRTIDAEYQVVDRHD